MSIAESKILDEKSDELFRGVVCHPEICCVRGQNEWENTLMKHKWILIPLLLALILVIWRFAIARPEAKTPPGAAGRTMQAIPVEVSPVRLTDLTERVNLSGNIEAKSSYIVAPKISGQLRILHINIGQRVNKGDLIAELDDRILQQELQRAQAAVEMARASARQSSVALEFATTELERIRELQSRSFISQSEFDVAYNQFANAQAQNNIAIASLNSALAALNSAELQLSFTKIRAEWNDAAPYRVIGERFVQEGAQLSAGSPVASLMDISSVIAVVDVIERDYGRIKLGQEATVKIDSHPETVFGGRVLRIAPVLQEATRQARVEIEIPNSAALLKPGMFARVALSYQTKRGVTAVDERAISKLRGKEGVFLVNREDSSVSFVEIQRGITGEGFVEIVQPRISGEVVSLGQDMLDDGRKVKISDSASPRGTQ